MTKPQSENFYHLSCGCCVILEQVEGKNLSDILWFIEERERENNTVLGRASPVCQEDFTVLYTIKVTADNILSFGQFFFFSSHIYGINLK